MPYERSAGTCLATVQNLCRHLTNGGTFDTTTAPTVIQVNDFITLAQAQLMGWMVRYGYGTAAPSDAGGLAWLEMLNALRASMHVEMSYPVTEAGKANPRMAEFVEQWNEGIHILASEQAVHLGLSPVAETNFSDNFVMSGLSLSRKTSRQSETDRVAGKFPRNWGQSYRAAPVLRAWGPDNYYDYNA